VKRFHDREDAGRKLAEQLRNIAAERPLVLALPRGGVPVAEPIARALRAPLDVWVVRKVGVPWQPELGVGAVAEGGYLYLNRKDLAALGLTVAELDQVVQAKAQEVEQRVRLFRGGQPGPVLRDRSVIVVDDGIATGGTARAALRSIRAQQPSSILLAVPVAAPEALEELAGEVDQVLCLLQPADLGAIARWYADFRQVSDEEVMAVLERARHEHARARQKRATG
jgi:putative phosphoribosyl transferase